jgi:hypothetical protein
MGLGRDRPNVFQNDVGREDGIDVVKLTFIDNSFIITMKKVLQGVNAPIGPGRTRERQPLTEKDLQGFFDLLLDAGGVILDLESAIVGAFVGDFQEVSGHESKDKGMIRGDP